MPPRVAGCRSLPIFEDDASVPQQGTNVFNKLINGDKVAMIIGPTLSNTAKITDPIAQQAGVPVLAISNTISGITEIGDYIFRDSLTEDVVIPHTIKIAKEKLGLKKVALLYGNDDAMTKAAPMRCSRRCCSPRGSRSSASRPLPRATAISPRS